MDVIKRQKWDARTARPMTPNNLDGDSVLHVHWTGDDPSEASKINTRAEAKAKMRAIQNYHMDTKRWADIAYSYVIFQAFGKLDKPLIFEGRRFEWEPASSEGRNEGNGAVCVVMGPGDPLLDGTVAALRQVYAHFPGKRVRGHRDVFGTECPGDKLYRRLPDIRRAPKRTPHLP